MRTIMLAAAAAAVAVPLAASPATAQQGYNERRETRECRRELRDADTRREYNRERRECARELAQARNRDWRTYRRYDYNRLEAGYNTYYADQYYRDGRYYRPYRLTRNDRIYRGQDGRYYCRRSDGTTGLIVGAGVGALIGNALDNGRSSLLGTLIGAGVGGAIGAQVDRGNVRCR
jgi:Ni/Co efflux regulator RcnB